MLRVVQHKHFTFTFEDLPGHGLHEFAFPRAQAPYLQVFLDSSEATAELGIVTTVEDPMKSTSSMYINCVDATRRYIAWSAARGEVFEAYQQLALLAQVSLPRAFTGRGPWLARSSLGMQIRGDAVLLAPCLRMVRCIVGRLSQLSSATAVVRLFVQHVSASEALMSKVGRPWRRGLGCGCDCVRSLVTDGVVRSVDNGLSASWKTSASRFVCPRCRSLTVVVSTLTYPAHSWKPCARTRNGCASSHCTLRYVFMWRMHCVLPPTCRLRTTHRTSSRRTSRRMNPVMPYVPIHRCNACSLCTCVGVTTLVMSQRVPEGQAFGLSAFSAR